MEVRMAVLMFETGKSPIFSGQNQEYRQRVYELIKAHVGATPLNFEELIKEEVYTTDEKECANILDKNKDCKVVFTMQGHDCVQYIATKRGLRVYEYRHESGTFVEVEVRKKRHFSYSKKSINLFGV